MKEIILNVFGQSSSVFKKYSRMMYWMPKFKNANPYLLPDPLPSDIKELARLALKKMSVDTRTKIVEYDARIYYNFNLSAIDHLCNFNLWGHPQMMSCLKGEGEKEEEM